jgi:cytochrome c oxidase subunit II
MKLVAVSESPYDARRMAPTRHTLVRLVGIVGLCLLLGACSFIEIDNAPLTIFDPKGEFAEKINNLFWPVFWIAVVVFVLVEGAILVAVLMFRDREGSKEAKQIHGSPKLEVVWTVIPALILAIIAVPTTKAVFELTECGSNAIEIDVIGHQWWFEFHYPDADINTANVMVIPAGQEVCANLTSQDVIHNFWIPALNGKRYLIPGQTTLLRLEADAPGEFWGHCAEFCGLSHSLMRARVQALSPPEYEAWLTAQQAETPVPAEGTPEWDGLQIYESKGCTQCHTVNFADDNPSGIVDNVIPEGSLHGPELTHFASRDVFAGATLPGEGQTREDALRLWLSDPPNYKPGSYMPNLGLTAQEIDSLTAWLDSNK